MDDTKQFLDERKSRIAAYPMKTKLVKSGQAFLMESLVEKYSYNFNWLGMPIIQYPQDIVAIQEILWETKPDIIVETGVARGGSLILYASLLEMCSLEGFVIGVDVDIRNHNRIRIEKHPFNHRIRLIENSSTADSTIEEVRKIIGSGKKVMVSLDSNHIHDHVLKELQLYAPLVSIGCYCVVFDTVVEDMQRGSFPDRPWDKGNNPRTAVDEFLRSNGQFVLDDEIEKKLIVTSAPGGYLLRVK